MSAPDSAPALRALAHQARVFAAYWPATPRPVNPTARQARALSLLVDAARAFNAKSDEEWVAEVAELRKALRLMWEGGVWKPEAWLQKEQIEKLLEE